jgi:hypothetical protein
LIQGVASALSHQLLEQASDCSYSLHQTIQLRKLFLGESSPAFRSASDVAETKEHVSDFTQRKTEFTGALNDCQAVKHRRIVASLPIDALGKRKQANPLAIPDRGGPKSNLSCDLRNGRLTHAPL